MPCTETVQGIFCFSEENQPKKQNNKQNTKIEPLGDLPVFQACRAAQQEHPAALLGKSRNAAVDLLAQLR